MVRITSKFTEHILLTLEAQLIKEGIVLHRSARTDYVNLMYTGDAIVTCLNI